MVKKDREIKQGATWNWWFYIKDDSTGDAVDLTDYDCALEIRLTKSTATTLLLISNDEGSIVITEASGKITITVPAATTAALDFDEAEYAMFLTSPGGVVDRIFEGKIRLNRFSRETP